MSKAGRILTESGYQSFEDDVAGHQCQVLISDAELGNRLGADAAVLAVCCVDGKYLPEPYVDGTTKISHEPGRDSLQLYVLDSGNYQWCEMVDEADKVYQKLLAEATLEELIDE